MKRNVHGAQKPHEISGLMDVFNHSSFEITRRYLGIAQDDRDEVYLKITVYAGG